jgi:peptidylprolyl isomerase
MRSTRSARLAPLALAAVLLVTACGDAQETDTAAEAASDTTAAVDTTAGADAADAPDATDAPAEPAGSPDKPAVEIPAELPTELVITDLVEGTGDGAVAGDTVIVNYVGVRSEDGTEFDNSYDRGAPFPVTLGTNSVIAGWEQGLVGVKQGGRRQLDIPADLAYGDSPQGDVIQAGDALTFVIDVVGIVPATDPADAPELTIEGAANREDLLIEDLITGDGAEIQVGDQAYLHLVAFRGDTGEQVASSWETGSPQPIVFEEAGTLPGIFQGMEGMKVGGRRQMVIPFEDAFGVDGNLDLGVPGSTDLVLVIDLLAVV